MNSVITWRSFLNRFIESSGAEAVVIGGNIAQSFPLFKDALLAGVQARYPNVLITTSVLGEQAALCWGRTVSGEW